MNSEFVIPVKTLSVTVAGSKSVPHTKGSAVWIGFATPANKSLFSATISHR